MNKKYIVTWDKIQSYTRELSKKLLLIKKWKKIIAVSRGGLVPSAILSRELNIRKVDTLCISSYDNNCKLKNIRVLKKPKGNCKDIIIIDDLVDTGRTAKIIRKMYPKAFFVTIFAKPIKKHLVDYYIIDISQNTWIEQPWDMDFSYVPPLASQIT
ncbi:xanthine phosphoribosyltransferase [Buchnera aphidicola (Taiwanaphis decaspermi)]|uniref:xanthine phosphoribosyltransferase n=1 Tax=Buchnera aphidicola TaxID=9 RepID=UPI0031B88E20